MSALLDYLTHRPRVCDISTEVPTFAEKNVKKIAVVNRNWLIAGREKEHKMLDAIGRNSSILGTGHTAS